jgi:RNA polymerase sigma-70 factor (ECF subfamily)
MNPHELEQLYDAHAAGLFHYLQSFTACEADARDLLQELFIKLTRSAGRSSEWRSERAWLYRLAHNLVIDWTRRRTTRAEYEHASAAEAPSLFQRVADPDLDTIARQLSDALFSLPPEQRAVMHLKLWEGLTFDEIATAQGTSPNTAASRYRYGLDKLRTLLRPFYEELQ